MIRNPSKGHIFAVMPIDVIQYLLNPLAPLSSLAAILLIQRIGKMPDQENLVSLQWQ